MSEPEFCVNCAGPEENHIGGVCPVTVAPPLCKWCKRAKTLHVDDKCPSAAFVAGKPGPGRPKGKGLKVERARIGGTIRRAKERLLAETIVGKGLDAIENALEPRMKNRIVPPPARTISDMKDAAIRVLNQQLWNLEGVAESEGLTESEESRLLKLLNGFNAALPKQVEKPAEKMLSELSDEELLEKAAATK